MRSPRLALTTLASATAGLALVAASTVPAHAAFPDYTIKSGTKSVGQSAITGTTVGAAGTPHITFATDTVEMTCDTGTAAGQVRLGTRNGLGAGVITSSAFNNCVGPLGLPLTVTQNQTWRLDATAPVRANGSVPGRIAAIKATVSAANPSQCSFVVTGLVGGAVTQRPTTNQLLKVGAPYLSRLTLSNVVGCFGLLANGDAATFAATYKLVAANGPLSIVNAPSGDDAS